MLWCGRGLIIGARRRRRRSQIGERASPSVRPSCHGWFVVNTELPVLRQSERERGGPTCGLLRPTYHNTAEIISACTSLSVGRSHNYTQIAMIIVADNQGDCSGAYGHAHAHWAGGSFRCGSNEMMQITFRQKDSLFPHKTVFHYNNQCRICQQSFLLKCIQSYFLGKVEKERVGREGERAWLAYM